MMFIDVALMSLILIHLNMILAAWYLSMYVSIGNKLHCFLLGEKCKVNIRYNKVKSFLL